MQANRILSETKTSFVWHLAKQGKSIIVPKITYHGFCGTCATRSTEVASSRWKLWPCLTRQIGPACLFAEQGNRVKIPDTEGISSLRLQPMNHRVQRGWQNSESSCISKVLFSVQGKSCVRWKPVIGRAVMAPREDWSNAFVRGKILRTWIDQSEDLQKAKPEKHKHHSRKLRC